MTVYQISGSTVAGDMDGSVFFINANDCINPITGNLGLNTVRIVNTDTANIATMYFVPYDVTYTFQDVTYTTDSADGVDAAFTVTVDYLLGYIVQVTSAGNDFLVGDLIYMSGTDLGGSTTANDLQFQVSAIDANGGITAIDSVSGTVNWPQSQQSSIPIFPTTESFIQLTNSPSMGGRIELAGDSGLVYITPITVVG